MEKKQAGLPLKWSASSATCELCEGTGRLKSPGQTLKPL